MDFPLDLLKPYFDSKETEFTAEMKERFNIYANLLVERNKQVNLTAITEPTEVVIKHFLDSLYFFDAVTPEENASLIDVGTGAGFPGLVIKIARNDMDITLLDGLNKRLVFLEEVAEKTGLSVKTVHLRAEEAGKKSEYREKFDFATARAVAKLNLLEEYCLPLLKIGGKFVSLKGPKGEEEIKESLNAVRILGGKHPEAIVKPLGEDSRTLIITEKISQTSSKYPRISAKIAKQPL